MPAEEFLISMLAQDEGRAPEAYGVRRISGPTIVVNAWAIAAGRHSVAGLENVTLKRTTWPSDAGLDPKVPRSVREITNDPFATWQQCARNSSGLAPASRVTRFLLPVVDTFKRGPAPALAHTIAFWPPPPWHASPTFWQRPAITPRTRDRIPCLDTCHLRTDRAPTATMTWIAIPALRV